MLTIYLLKALYVIQFQGEMLRTNGYRMICVLFRYKTNSVTSSRLSKILYTGNSFEQITRPTTTKWLATIYKTMLNRLLSTITCDSLLMRTVPVSKMRAILSMAGFLIRQNTEPQ